MSSVPSHLTRLKLTALDKETDFSLTIGTEKFINGGNFYPPGASLLTADDLLVGDNIAEITGYGRFYNLANYTAMTSNVLNNISFIAQHSNEWTNMTFSECQAEFGLYGAACNGLTAYRDLVLIMAEPDGWTRDKIWNLMGNQTRLWDQIIPLDQPNHLFFYTTCQMGASTTYRGTNCHNSCFDAVGGRYNELGDQQILSKWPSGYPFFHQNALWFANGTESKYHYRQNTLTSGLQPGTFDMSIQYCLAKPIKSVCHVGVSPMLLLVIVLSVVVKTTIADSPTPNHLGGGMESVEILQGFASLHQSIEPDRDLYREHNTTGEYRELHQGEETLEGNVQSGEIFYNSDHPEPRIYGEYRELRHDLESREVDNATIQSREPANHSRTKGMHTELEVTAEDMMTGLKYVARSKIKWGVLQMPPEWYEDHDFEPLGFAIEGSKVGTPVAGRYYL
ncbi:hypothetical protein GQX73_g7854 [Xylaria multiplex]|uniref:Uncharacterized protein n=1 Tax=Xylaria multiplex TaxID=323545 RepID=A0A7C8MPS6_9PEZI|nr:hypothetical protein GQX73_g7854 [Xylaria multiplex]